MRVEHDDAHNLGQKPMWSEKQVQKDNSLT